MTESTKGRRLRETKPCAECGRNIDIRGMHAHLEKHQRDALKNGNGLVADGNRIRLVEPLEPKGIETNELVRAFALGLEMGQAVRRAA